MELMKRKKNLIEMIDKYRAKYSLILESLLTNNQGGFL